MADGAGLNRNNPLGRGLSSYHGLQFLQAATMGTTVS